MANQNNEPKLINFSLPFQIFDQWGAKDSVVSLTVQAKTLEDAMAKADENLKKSLRKNWTYKFIGEVKK